MSWCAELMEKAKADALANCTALMAEMIDLVYDRHARELEHHREKLETKVLGYHFSRERAKIAVDKLKNKDGTSGGYWSLEDVAELARSSSLDFAKKNYNLYDLYYTVNMIRSDYYSSTRAATEYIALALDFLEDKDAPDGKAMRYYLAMSEC